MEAKVNYMQVVVLNGKKFISMDDLQAWIDTPENLAIIAELLAEGMDHNVNPITIMKTMMGFPLRATEQIINKELEESRDKAKLN